MFFDRSYDTQRFSAISQQGTLGDCRGMSRIFPWQDLEKNIRMEINSKELPAIISYNSLEIQGNLMLMTHYCDVILITHSNESILF